MTRESRAACALAVASLLVAGCLPRGDAPSGHQILADRNASLLELVPTAGDGVLRVLFFRPGATSDYLNLWAISVDGDGNSLGEKLLYTGVSSADELSFRPQTGSKPGYPFDARGQVYVHGTQVDPVTGQSRAVGTGFALISDSGQRVMLPAVTEGWVLYETAGDTTTALLDASVFVGFSGEVLFYLTTTGDLMRVVPGGSPERLVTHVVQSRIVPAHAQQLVLTKADVDFTLPGIGQEVRPLPAGSYDLFCNCANLIDDCLFTDTVAAFY